MSEMDIGIIGMAVMGSNLALNMADHGFKVAAYNRTAAVTKAVMENTPHKNLHGYYNLTEFLNSLQKPRRIMLMIKAGKPVDLVIEELLPHLDKDDIIIDGGNSFFKDTIRRNAYLQEKGINYFGVGISGGEKGARLGPSIMPGGNKEKYKHIQPILESISAHVGNDPCCTYIGDNGAGHYVKMVHNGIEYADMQLIAETYLLLRYVGGFDNKKISHIFNDWNQGELHSYLIGITADIFAETDEDSKPGELIDKILDSAGQKGTGRWTSIQALEEGIDTSIITAACNMRSLSNCLADREKAAKYINVPQSTDKVDEDFIEKVRKSLYIAKIVAYAQGFALYAAASKTYNWHLNFGKIASIFRAGCIIQAEFLNKITAEYKEDEQLSNLMFNKFFLDNINKDQSSLRDTLCLAVQRGIPVPAFANALQYIDAYRSERVGANLIQAQRDYFGAHTYKRIDKEGVFHHKWQEHYKI